MDRAKVFSIVRLESEGDTAKDTRRKARQFYRESRRRCREFGGPRNRDGGVRRYAR